MNAVHIFIVYFSNIIYIMVSKLFLSIDIFLDSRLWHSALKSAILSDVLCSVPQLLQVNIDLVS